MENLACMEPDNLPAKNRALMNPSLSPQLEQLVAAGSRTIFPDSGAQTFLDPSWQPPRLKPDTAAAVLNVLNEFEIYLKPAKRDDIAGQILTLLAHFFVPDMPTAFQERVITDWIDDLEEYPAWAIDRACRNWRRFERRKPLPSDIRKLAEKAVVSDRTKRDVLRRVIDAQTVHDHVNAPNDHRPVVIAGTPGLLGNAEQVQHADPDRALNDLVEGATILGGG